MSESSLFSTLVVVKARNGAPTLQSGEKAVYSHYDPRREAERTAAAIPGDRIAVVGLGLGYLAQALGPRLSRVIAFEGEVERLRSVAPEQASCLEGRISKTSALHDVERCLVDAWRQGESLVFDPVLSAAPETARRLDHLVGMLKTSVHAVVIHLKTAGDVLRSLAAVQVFKRSNPGWRLTFITEEPYGELAGLSEGLDAVHQIPRGAVTAVGIDRPLIAFNLGGDPQAAALLDSLDPVYRVGYVNGAGGIVLHDDRVAGYAEDLGRIRNHMNRYHLYHVILGLPPDSAPPRLRVRRVSGDYGIVQFGAGSGADVWAAKRAEPRIVGEALRRWGGTWWAVGGQDEAGLAASAGIPAERNLCGKTSWTGLAEKMAGARLYVGMDSGPTHLAAALGVPTLSIFGFTSPILNAPVGPRVLVLQADMPCAFGGCRVACPEKTCVASLTPEVIEAGLRLLVAESACDQLDAAACIRRGGARFYRSGVPVENADPLAAFRDAEPRIGPPIDAALSLAREWLETSERY